MKGGERERCSAVSHRCSEFSPRSVLGLHLIRCGVHQQQLMNDGGYCGVTDVCNALHFGDCAQIVARLFNILKTLVVRSAQLACAFCHSCAGQRRCC